MGDRSVSAVHPNLDGWENVVYYKNMCPVAEDICQHIVNRWYLYYHSQLRSEK
jgi:hypothetical protein